MPDEEKEHLRRERARLIEILALWQEGENQDDESKVISARIYRDHVLHEWQR